MTIDINQRERELLSVLLINARDNVGNSLWITSGQLGELHDNGKESWDWGDVETMDVYYKAEKTVAKLLKKFGIGEGTETYQLNQEAN